MTTQLETNVLFDKEHLLVHLPDGLIGLEEWRHFILVTPQPEEPFRLLQAVDDERFSLIVIDPRHIVADYEVILTKADAQALSNQDGLYGLQLKNPDMEVYCILSIQAEPFDVTANLLGPLVINRQTGLGRQVILSDSNYNPRHPVMGQSAAHSIEKVGESTC